MLSLIKMQNNLLKSSWTPIFNLTSQTIYYNRFIQAIPPNHPLSFLPPVNTYMTLAPNNRPDSTKTLKWHSQSSFVYTMFQKGHRLYLIQRKPPYALLIANKNIQHTVFVDYCIHSNTQYTQLFVSVEQSRDFCSLLEIHTNQISGTKQNARSSSSD